MSIEINVLETSYQFNLGSIPGAVLKTAAARFEQAAREVKKTHKTNSLENIYLLAGLQLAMTLEQASVDGTNAQALQRIQTKLTRALAESETGTDLD